MINEKLSFDEMANRLQNSDKILCISEFDGTIVDTTNLDITVSDQPYVTEQLMRYTPHLAYDIEKFCINNTEALTAKYLRMSPQSNIVNTAIIDFTNTLQDEIAQQSLGDMSQTQFEQFEKSLLIKIEPTQPDTDDPTYTF